MDRIAILPTGERMNPAAPMAATYYNVGQVAYVLFKISEARTRPTRVVTSFGGLSIRGFDHSHRVVRLGDVLTFEYDQTNAVLGEYRVVGIAHFDTGNIVGEIPNRALSHSVVK